MKPTRIRKHIFIKAILLLSLSFFNSCKTSGVHEKSSSSWVVNLNKKNIKTIKAGRIVADKSGGSASIEAEIGRMLPLLFLEKGYIFVDENASADFIVEVSATERDYFVSWSNKKSIAIEVILRSGRAKNETGASQNRTDIETPLAAGRTVAQGVLGLSSSKNLTSLLRTTIKKAARAAKKIDPALYAPAERE
jgi:hypothetical protein